ncbi:hypothetical protein NHP21005_01880 [Helicobacter sp. NHP21005]|nr:hypothetical protein NHP21005_01880 [Helicobacter sp. NHP21005]
MRSICKNLKSNAFDKISVLGLQVSLKRKSSGDCPCFKGKTERKATNPNGV